MDLRSYNVGWICALPLEFAASQSMLDKSHENVTEQDIYDRNNYRLGEIGGHKVVMACLPDGRYGIGSAETVATNMLRTFPSIKLGLMVGIGGGVPSETHDIRLGDVVVSKPEDQHGGVINYEIGRIAPGGEFRKKGHLNKPPLELLNALSRLESAHEMGESSIETYIRQALEKYPGMQERYSFPGREKDVLYLTECEHEKFTDECAQCTTLHHANGVTRRPRSSPKVHYGLIGSGSKVVASIRERDRLQREYGILCFETEAAGLMDSFPCLVIRGISDYADSYKGKDWQRYAAMSAAAYSKELLQIIPRGQVAKMQDAKAITKTIGLNLGVIGWARNLNSFRNSIEPLKPATRIKGMTVVSLIICLLAMAMHFLLPIQPQQDVMFAPESSLLSCMDLTIPVFVVMGNTGVGKSTFIDTLGGKDCSNRRPAIDCANLLSCTSNITFYKTSLDGEKSIYLIDTPGFVDVRSKDSEIEQRTDEKIMRDVYTALAGIYPASDKLVRGLIYLHDISQPRLSRPALEHSDLFHILCGKDRFDSLALVLNKWSTDWSEGIKQQKRKLDLKKHYWADMIDRGSHFEDHDGSATSAHRILRNLHDRSTKINFSIGSEVEEKEGSSESGKHEKVAKDGKRLVEERKSYLQEYIDHAGWRIKLLVLILRYGTLAWVDYLAIYLSIKLFGKSDSESKPRNETMLKSLAFIWVSVAIVFNCSFLFTGRQFLALSFGSALVALPCVDIVESGPSLRALKVIQKVDWILVVTVLCISTKTLEYMLG